MAILTSVPGLSVHIRVSGEIATEYPNPDGDSVSEPTSSVPVSYSYIESRDGSEYAIEVTVGAEFVIPSGCDSVVIHVYIDGEWVASPIGKIQAFRTAPETIACSGTWTASDHSNMCIKRRFVFIPLSTSENQESLSAVDTQKIKSCGSIKIIVYTAKQSTATTTFQPVNFNSRDSISAPEKLLKGKELSHGSSFTAGVLETPPLCTPCKNKKAVGIFHFSYKSREAMKRSMIIPRSPSLSPTTPLRDELNSLPDSEIRRLAKERLEDIKGSSESQRVKRQPESPPTSSRLWKTVKLDDGREAIDLSED